MSFADKFNLLNEFNILRIICDIGGGEFCFFWAICCVVVAMHG